MLNYLPIAGRKKSIYLIHAKANIVKERTHWKTKEDIVVFNWKNLTHSQRIKKIELSNQQKNYNM